MFQQLSEFEVNHYQKLKALLKSLQEKGEWILYEGTPLKNKKIPFQSPNTQGQAMMLTDALKKGSKREQAAALLSTPGSFNERPPRQGYV